MTIIEAFDKFILDKTIENLSEYTIADYKCMVSLFIKYIGTSNDVLLLEDEIHLKRYILHLRDKNLSSRTIHTYVKQIKVFYKYLVSKKYITCNPASDMRIRYDKKIPEILSVDEVKSLMSIKNIRDRLIVLLVLDTGLRKREISNLKVSDIKKDMIFVHSGKGGKDRVVPLSSVMHDALMDYIDNRPSYTDEVFQCVDGRPLSYVGIRCVFNRLKKKTGIARLTPHLLRHTYGTYYVERGGDIKVLQILLGHSDTKTTEIYVHLAKILDVSKYSQFSIINALNEKTDD